MGGGDDVLEADYACGADCVEGGGDGLGRRGAHGGGVLGGLETVGFKRRVFV